MEETEEGEEAGDENEEETTTTAGPVQSSLDRVPSFVSIPNERTEEKGVTNRPGQ